MLLRDYRCRRYARRLKELVRCARIDPLLLTEGEYDGLARRYADETCPTPAECLSPGNRLPVVIHSGLNPAPASVWEEDAALFFILLRPLHLRPTVEMGLALYTASLCRKAGLSVCPEPDSERDALPEGATLGDLLVEFMFPHEANC